MGRSGVQKRKKDENRPKRPTSAYFYFMAQERETAKAKGKSISKVAEWTKEVSVIWRELSTKDRKKFDDKAAIDKARYSKEMAAYKGVAEKPDGKPKRPQTSYFLWLATFRADNKEKFVENKELLKEAGRQWKKLTAAQRKPFEKMATEEKQKYSIAMKEFNEKQDLDAKKPKVAAPADDDEDDEEGEDDDEEEDDEPAKNGAAAEDDDDEEESEEESE